MSKILYTPRNVIISGYFNPGPHAGHIAYAKEARQLAGENGFVYCIVNSDYQAILKKGYSFIPENDRLAAMGALKYVDKAVVSIDKDRTVCETIKMLHETEPVKPTVFYNSGDVTPEKPCAETHVCKQFGIEIIYGGTPKIQSSSWILEDSVKLAYEKMYLKTD